TAELVEASLARVLQPARADADAAERDADLGAALADAEVAAGRRQPLQRQEALDLHLARDEAPVQVLQRPEVRRERRDVAQVEQPDSHLWHRRAAEGGVLEAGQ